jgi:single-stranded-DNA-specific exonuclease
MVIGTNGRMEWSISEVDRALTRSLASETGLHPIIVRILISRGIVSAIDAQHFLTPTLDNLSDPFLLEDMAVAVNRLARARDRNEHVLVFGDYDVDGISATALLVRALRRFGIASCSYGMPNRLIDGYGLSPDRVDSARDAGVSLIVTVDNGIAAHDACKRAQELGIDIIVTDHHLIEGALPPAVAVINPQRQAPDHPCREACGAAVAFHLARALTGETVDLDLVALGTVADVVPLRGENRNLVAAGIREMACNARPGIRMLAKVAGVNLDSLTAEQVAFQLAPRINAGGRMGEGLSALSLLLTDSMDEAGALAEELDAANQERRALENDTVAQVLEELSASFRPEQRTIVLARRGWHRGVIGIVASRIQSNHYRPVVLIGIDDDGIGRGSARSIAGFNIAQAMSACTEHLVTCGGHAAAAGLTVREECIPAFIEMFEAEAAKSLPTGDLYRKLRIDAQVGLSEIDSRLVTQLDQLQPFGNINPTPLFCSFGAEPLPHSWRELRGGHMKVALRNGNRVMDAIGFRMAERIAELSSAPAVDVAFSPQFNTWRGETSVQLVLKDIRPTV